MHSCAVYSFNTLIPELITTNKQLYSKVNQFVLDAKLSGDC